MKFLIINESQHAVPRQFISRWLTRLEKHFVKRGIFGKNDPHKELILVFLDRGPAKKLNLEYRGKNYATDVLSFAALEPDSLGELVLCPEVLKRQAREHGLTYQRELGYMLLHGILHLLGYDHEANEEEAEKMFAIQDEAFEILLK